MRTIATVQEFEALKSGPALLVLFGGAQCGVCQAIKPGIERLMTQRFPGIVRAYVDCERLSDACAQQGVFTVPVVKLFVEGKLCLDMAGSFSLLELASKIDRIYQLWQGAPD